MEGGRETRGRYPNVFAHPFTGRVRMDSLGAKCKGGAALRRSAGLSLEVFAQPGNLLAYAVLHQILGGAGAFDPYAPEAQRRQQIAGLREHFERKAG
jgi:hypothetical protein